MTAFVRQSGIIRMPYSENPIRRDGRTKIQAIDAEESQRSGGSFVITATGFSKRR
jgi:hypothetical protein